MACHRLTVLWSSCHKTVHCAALYMILYSSNGVRFNENNISLDLDSSLGKNPHINLPFSASSQQFISARWERKLKPELHTKHCRTYKMYVWLPKIRRHHSYKAELFRRLISLWLVIIYQWIKIQRHSRFLAVINSC